MSSIGKRIDAIIKARLASVMKASGFRKQAKDFRRQFEDRVDVLNVQNSQWNQGEEGQFTVNLGVYFPQVEELAGPGLRVGFPEGNPKVYQCTVQTRLGKAYSEGAVWWELNANSDNEVVAADLSNQVELQGLAWFEQMSDLSNVMAELNKRHPTVKSAVVALHLGNRDEAKDLLNRAIENSGASSWVTGWGRAHGLLPR